MLATKRRSEPGVIQRLLDQPFRFQFFQAVRVLELWLKRNGVAPETDCLRFRNSLSLSFPASEIEALGVEDAGADCSAHELEHALSSGALRVLEITPAFMGFLGGCGALPLHYTERIAGHALYERDDGPRAFLDVFSNRIVTQLYEAWGKYRLEFKYALDESDAFLPLLRALAGIGQRGLTRRLGSADDGVLDETLGSYAAALRHRPASAALIQAVLQDYFQVPIALQQFIGRWYGLPQPQQTRLGLGNAVLGSTALAGARVWQRDLCLLVCVGPLNREAFNAFLPGGRAANSLEKMITMFSGSCLEYEVQLVLRARDVRGVMLTSGGDGARLGWDSFLAAAGGSDDRSDVKYRLHALA